MSETILISLGGTCAVCYNIRQFKASKGEHKVERFPFDWTKTSIKQLRTVLEKDFENYEKLEVKKFSENHPILEFTSQSPNAEDDVQYEGQIKDTPGSLILINPYGIIFAHQIIEKSAVDSFSISLRDERINAFRNLQNIDQNSEPRFIRLETGKLKKDYINDLKMLVELLAQYRKEFTFILLVHESNKEIFMNVDIKSLKLLYFERFEEDWKYPGIDWSLVFII